MTPKWLLETEIFQHDAKDLVDALEKRGIEYKICQFGKTYDEMATVFPKDDCVVVYGSIQLGKAVQNKTLWKPGLFYNSGKLDCTPVLAIIC